MLKRIICALMSVALLVNSSMIASATMEGTTDIMTTYSESAAAEEDTSSTTVVEATVTSEAADAEETTTTVAEPMTPEKIGAAIRENLDVKVKDIVIFRDVQELYDAEDNSLYADAGWNIWIIGIDDANQRYRIHCPKVNSSVEAVMYMRYGDAQFAVVMSHDGMVIGDLDASGTINALDFTLMKRAFLEDEWSERYTLLSDWTGDGKIMMNDLVMMQKFLLGYQ